MSDKQLESNRANSEKSTGPKTPEGKRRSSLNSYRHGLTGQVHTATAEELAVFQKHCAAILAELAPRGPMEIYFAQSIAEDMWRLQRARALENGIFAQGFRDHVDSIAAGHPETDASLSQSQTWAQQAHNLHLLTIYEGRIRRALEKNRAELAALQTKRKADYAHALEQATLLVEHAESKGETYDPASDFLPAREYGGFVFSTTVVEAAYDRSRRVREAWSYHLSPAARAAGSPNPSLDPQPVC
jgi:hypothetical protein